MSKHFYNWTSEDFVAKWGGKELVLKAGEVVYNSLVGSGGDVVILDPGVVFALGRHLAKREMAKEGITLEAIEITDEYTQRATELPETKETVEEKVEVPKKRMGRPKKVVEEVKETADII